MGLFDADIDFDKDPIDLFGTHSNEQAAAYTRQASEEALQLQKDLFNQLYGDAAPVRESRDAALGLLRGIQEGTFTPSASPGLGYRVGEAVGDVRAQAAARGKLYSGGREMAEQDVTSRAVQQDYNDAVNRLLNLAGYSTQDLNTQNALLQQNVGSQGNQLFNQGIQNANQQINRQNFYQDVGSAGSAIGGYFAGGGR